jgi:hypothetical protein
MQWKLKILRYKEGALWCKNSFELHKNVGTPVVPKGGLARCRLHKT